MLILDGVYADHGRMYASVRRSGERLPNDDNAAKIRALLLAGIRAAVLWQQLGGSRWKLFWSRRKYVATAKKFTSYN